MGKKRSDNQRLEDLSRAKAKAILSKFVVNDLENDFGIDLEVALTEEDVDDVQEVQPQNFYIQLKSSHDFGDKDNAVWDPETTDLKFWIRQPIPVALALYCEKEDRIYWTIVQDYVWDKLDKSKPGWRRQDYCRVKVSKSQTLDQLDILEDAVIRCQNRILRRHSRGLNIGEGVAFTPSDFSEMDNQIESDLLNFKGHSLMKAHELLNDGKIEEASEILQEVYETPRDDEGKLKSISGKIFLRDPFEPEVAFEVMELAEEGIEIAHQLDKVGEEQFMTVHKHVSGLYVLLRKRRQAYFSRRIQEEGDYEMPGFNYIFNVEMRELAAFELSAAASISDALATLLNNNLYYEYAVCLDPILDFISRQLMELVALDVIDRKELREEGYQHPFVDQCEQLLDFFPENEIAFNLNKGLGLYYYNSYNPEKAKERLQTAIQIAKDLDDERLIERTQEILDQIEEHTDPYEFYEQGVDEDKDRNEEEIPTVEHQRMMRDLVEMQGYDLDDSEDEYVDALKLGIQDANPSEYLRHCEHLRIKYWSTSPFGKATGVSSLGTKVMWCKHGGQTSGLSLETLFNGFKARHCEGCEHHSQRGDDWECTLGKVREQEKDPEFVSFLEKFEKNSPF